MKILVDTHLVLWWAMDNPRLSAEARGLLADPENTIFVSAVNLWEIWLKKGLGKLQIPDDFADALWKEAFEPLPLTVAHAASIAALPWLNRDPFDRMLIAQALSERLVFLTADSQLSVYGSPVRIV